MTVTRETLLLSTPLLVKGVDFSKANLSPKEAFLLSRIDGSMKVADISKISSMSIDDTLSAILSLALKEIIRFKEFSNDQLMSKPATPKPPTSKPPTPKPAASQPPPTPTSQPAASKAPSPTAPAPKPPATQPTETPPPDSTPAPQPTAASSPPAPREITTPAAAPPPRKASPPSEEALKIIQPLYKRSEIKEDLADLLHKGNLKELPFPELLGKLYVEKLSGILRLMRRSGMGYKELYIRSGMPIYVGGTYIIEKECLGQLLKMAGKITSHDLGRSIDLVKQGKLQGEALIQLGIINGKILTGVLKWQAEIKLAEIFTWKAGEGTYEFYRTATFARDFIPVQIVLGALILKGIKRGFPYSVVQSQLGPHTNKYVIKRSKTEFDSASLAFQLPEQRLFEKVIDGSLTIKQIVEESQMDPQMVNQCIYALIATKLVELRDRPATGSDEDKLVEDLKSRLALSQKGDFFDCLGIHWTSVGWKVQEGWDKVQKIYGPESKYQQSGVDDMVGKAKAIYDFGKKAYEALINDQRRAEYRREIFNETKLQLSSDLQYQQAESQLLWKEDYRHAVEILESAAELAPTNWVIHAAYGCALIKRYYPNNSAEYQKGEKVLQRALVQGSKNDIVHFYAGHAYWAMRRTNQAKAEFEMALRINPKNIDASKALRAMAKASS